MKSGFVSIVGRTNVGKSTLINAILGEKISIISPKSQTTRDSIQGIYNDEESQIIFIDTPGIHKPSSELGNSMDKMAYNTIRDCEIAVFLVDGSKPFSEGDQYLFDHLKFDCKLIVCFNKIDLTNIILINKLKNTYKEKFPEAIFIEISALEGFNVDGLIKIIKENLDEGPQFYDVNMITNKDLKFRVQEIVREKALHLLSEEVPHGIAILCDDIDFGQEKNIFVKIIVERESHKGIVIGQKGKMIKKIGTRARLDIEKLIGRHINLELNVQVVDNWKNSSSFLAKIGYK
ncbi:MAG TPA: GTPase Era [Candidatus Onthovivens sp.]|nr:GTPase Era [Candidatus Onthovivens sp.]